MTGIVIRLKQWRRKVREQEALKHAAYLKGWRAGWRVGYRRGYAAAQLGAPQESGHDAGHDSVPHQGDH